MSSVTAYQSRLRAVSSKKKISYFCNHKELKLLLSQLSKMLNIKIMLMRGRFARFQYNCLVILIAIILKEALSYVIELFQSIKLGNLELRFLYLISNTQ